MGSINHYSAVLFDLEGTLVNFQWKTDEAVREARTVLTMVGLDESLFSEVDYAALFNRAMAASERLGPPFGRVREKLEGVYDRFDLDALDRWTVKGDTLYVLENLKELGLLTGLVTNAGRNAVSLLLDSIHLERLLNVVITRSDVRRLKPKGDGIQLALDALGVAKEKALFVGDSVNDIAAAREVGVDVAIILGGESERRDIERHNPKLMLRSLSQVLQIL
jgi:HAD superfamily hydrolase (TIGR01549 family)